MKLLPLFTLFLFIVLLALVNGIALIFSLNTLFDTGIELNLRSIASALILIILFGANNSRISYVKEKS